MALALATIATVKKKTLRNSARRSSTIVVRSSTDAAANWSMLSRGEHLSNTRSAPPRLRPIVVSTRLFTHAETSSPSLRETRSFFPTTFPFLFFFLFFFSFSLSFLSFSQVPFPSSFLRDLSANGTNKQPPHDGNNVSQPQPSTRRRWREKRPSTFPKQRIRRTKDETRTSRGGGYILLREDILYTGAPGSDGQSKRGYAIDRSLPRHTFGRIVDVAQDDTTLQHRTAA